MTVAYSFGFGIRGLLLFCKFVEIRRAGTLDLVV
jgi:hypothetical protein